ncbi:IS3 family transposase [Oceanirhabdus sp. W0125-5]|nr:IS3 family transposase [Oceanirhabdus sp. W0125-5]WBW94753.1 IS3 family transposase [Oceanirhabdus sp. W0125-5]WBW96172.1 IS3 family transposase [Oceanirhabdus sp. W0125-5]WBW96339.1 IS3 family transposase [Oceanirhabdus sp. W0125-5]WBW96408.1 IS3 family transposase [Oceanirhabdus sp. W0125-5]WBW96639.1 IS3 family transposase [Oceanirhabdus sp. W0125-5]
MSKKIFTEEQIETLAQNKYVKNVTNKAITYTDEFKKIFIAENQNGKFPREIFEECGFDVDIIGIERVRSSGKRWRAAYRHNGVCGLADTRRNNSGKPTTKELSLEEKYARLQAQNNLLKAENELLKKLDMMGKDDDAKEIKILPKDKFIIIRDTVKKYNLKNMISYLCNLSGVSRSGYYNYFSATAMESRNKRELCDEVAKDLILKAYKFKNRKKGARQIKLTLDGQFGIVYNLKRIRRIMRKYNIVCPIRKANPYRRMAKATHEHRVVPNLLNREFKQNIPGKVLLTDITYLTYGNNKRAYLSTIKDGSTNEILAYNVATSLSLDIATDTIYKLLNNKDITLAPDAFIHSDQGAHYTSPNFQKLVKSFGLGQSMSRRGNCWDNAPQESFFGHFKDEAYIKSCTALDELKDEIDEYMDYYNNYRYQWNLKKMTPVSFRNHLQAAA